MDLANCNCLDLDLFSGTKIKCQPSVQLVLCSVWHICIHGEKKLLEAAAECQVQFHFKIVHGHNNTSFVHHTHQAIWLYTPPSIHFKPSSSFNSGNSWYGGVKMESSYATTSPNTVCLPLFLHIQNHSTSIKLENLV